MLTSPADTWDRVRQSFAEQFEQDGTSFVYCKSQKGEAIRVSAQERSRFLDEFDRNLRRAKWIIYIGLFVALGGAIAFSVLRGSDLDQAGIVVGIGVAVIPYFAYLRWAWAAPARELAGRTPLAGERAPEEVQRLKFQRITYSQLGTAALGGLAFPFLATKHGDLFSGWNRLWLVFGGGLVLLAAVQAFRKWRLEQADADRRVVRRPSSPGINAEPGNSTSLSKSHLWRYFPFAIMVFGLLFIAYTRAGQRLAKVPSFWSILMIGCGAWALITVARAFANGQIEPFARGFYNTYERETQPKRFWASVAWNTIFGCFCIWLAFEMVTPAQSQSTSEDVNRCFDTHVIAPQDELAACNRLLANRNAQSAVPLYVGRSFAYTRIGDHQRAIDDLTEALHEKPDDAGHLYWRGVEYYRAGNPERAIQDLSDAIRLQPDYFYALLDRGTLYSKLGDTRRAIADLDEAIRLRPNDSGAFNNRGTAYLRSGDLAHAIADFSEVLRLDPSHVIALENRALAYSSAGDLRHAIADCSAAIRLTPGDAEGYDCRAIAYARNSDFQQAISDFSNAIRLKPRDARAYYYRGMAYEKLGNSAQARADQALALRLDPNVAKAAQAQTQQSVNR